MLGFTALASLSDNIAGVLIALFGGVAASLAAGYFSRPKTKAEAHKENATAHVSMSGDAREWAEWWSTKAQAAEARADTADEGRDSAEERTRVVEGDRASLVAYVRLLEAELTGMGVILPPITERLRGVIDRPQDH